MSSPSAQELAAIYEQADRPADAEQTWVELLERARASSPTDGEVRSSILYQLGHFYMRQDRKADAEAAYLRALEAVSHLPAGVSARDDLYAALTFLYESEGRHTLASYMAANWVTEIAADARVEREYCRSLVFAMDWQARILGQLDRSRETNAVRMQIERIRDSLPLLPQNLEIEPVPINPNDIRPIPPLGSLCIPPADHGDVLPPASGE